MPILGMRRAVMAVAVLVVVVVGCGLGAGAVPLAPWKDTPSPVPPVVLMHGITDSAANLDLVVSWVREGLPDGTYVRAMEIGNGPISSIFMPMREQVETYAKNVRSDPALANGFNAVGFSQGGLVTRGYIEMFNDPPVINFLSWASPQFGVFGLDAIPDFIQEFFLGDLPYNDFVQSTFSFAQYWRNPYDLKMYLENSTFLADLNNERPVKNATYKANMVSLMSVMLLKSTNDDVINPRVSSHFGFFANETEKATMTFNQTELYKQDYIGLRQLDDDNRIIFHTSNCTHPGHLQADCRYAFQDYSLPILLQPWEAVTTHWDRIGVRYQERRRRR